MESTLTLYVPYRSYKKIFSPISVIELLKEKGEKRRYRRYRNLTEYLKVDAVVTYMLRNLPCLDQYHLAY